jgi:alpha-ketoglutarate-dependent taurine dioxygenase
MDKNFPHIIDGSDIQDHQAWLATNRSKIEQELQTTGAILFRNFSLKSRHELSNALATLIPAQEMLDYTGGTSPREKVGEGIYSSTKMPFFLKIPLHSEMAYRKKFPKKILFYCETAPLFGGETPIVDIRKVYKDIPAEIRVKLEREGIVYYRILKNYTPMKRFLSRFNPMIETGTWQFVFKTNDREDVNKYCREHLYEAEWNSDGSVLLKTSLPASVDNSWFNSFHFFQVHHRIWGRFMTGLFKTLLFISGGKNLSATTGKANRLSSSEISLIVDAYEKNQTAFKWQEGDLLYLNNTVTAHGRNPYFGKRKILVSLADEGEFI